MPLIHRVTMDMFEFESVVDFMVNPVNLLGVSGGGLALEFKKRVPGHIEPYRDACKDKSLRIGTVQVLDKLDLLLETDQTWGMINFPTKRHYANHSDPDDIRRGLQALRELLQSDTYRYACIGMPMLGCGLGKQDYDVVYPMMVEALADLDATVFLSMSPERTELKPRYLTIVGPTDFGLIEKEQQTIDWVIDKSLETKMEGLSLSDYTGIVSGGHPGVDAYIGGTDYMQDDQATYVYRKTGKSPLVVKPNKARNGITANIHQGNLLCEIADDIILIKPKGHNNNRMSAMQVWLEGHNAQREREGLIPRRIAIYGDRDTNPQNEDLLIPQAGDIPY